MCGIISLAVCMNIHMSGSAKQDWLDSQLLTWTVRCRSFSFACLTGHGLAKTEKVVRQQRVFLIWSLPFS